MWRLVQQLWKISTTPGPGPRSPRHMDLQRSGCTGQKPGRRQSSSPPSPSPCATRPARVLRSWSSITSHRVTALPPRWLPHPLWLRGSIVHVTSDGWKRFLRTKTHFTYTHSVTPRLPDTAPLPLRTQCLPPPPTVTSAWITLRPAAGTSASSTSRSEGIFKHKPYTCDP